MSRNLTQKLIEAHLLEGVPEPGEEVGIRIDQTLTQDATGTLVMLELEAMNLDRAKTEVSVQYVDHNLLQEDHKNPDDHAFLQSAARKFGLWFSRPGNGVSHPVHQQRFGKPGKTLLGSDSHTCAAGAIGMLAIGTGGLDVARAICGFPYYVRMPSVWGVELTGRLPDWVSAKDVILEMLRRHGVKGAVNKVVEYHGTGLAELSAMDRHVIANMGAELGATASMFPSDEQTRRFLASQGREDDWESWEADGGADYDERDTIDLSELVPLIALPSSPGNVVPVSEVAGKPIFQSYLGSSANPGYRDFAVVAEMVRDRTVHDDVSFDVNPVSRQLLATLTRDSRMLALIQSGARIHQAGCNGCIGMGQAPATDRISLRTVPRNFPGRSGTREDKVYLVSPETAAASALTGKITDPRDLGKQGMAYPRIEEPGDPVVDDRWMMAPTSEEEARSAVLTMGPNVKELPELDAIPETLSLPVLLKCGDNLSTDEILPAGANVLPLRSNIPAISEYAFAPIDPDYPARARDVRETSGHAIVAGENYGQGSSREHAALAPRFLGLRLVLAVSFSRIHWQNLVNFGVLPLTFANPSDGADIHCGTKLTVSDLHTQIREGMSIDVVLSDSGRTIEARHQLSDRQVNVLLEGGLIAWARKRLVSDVSA